MATSVDLSVIITQSPAVAAAQGAVSGKSEVQQANFAQEVQKASDRDKEKVEKTAESHAVTKVDKDARREAAPDPGTRQHHEPEQEEDADKEDQQASPWSGKIINLHI